MGLLDDAIRQHLELKRRHGADPSEVARQENEALGPPRRGGPATEEHELDGAGALSPDAEEYDDDLLVDEAPPLAPPRDEPAVGEPDVEEPPRPSQPVGEPEAPVAPPAPVEEPPHTSPDEDVEAYETLERPPARHDAKGDEPHAAEDVLEETPEFLQETPEHERLWFEQKPPKDFDF
jgi:hypothetical protein